MGTIGMVITITLLLGFVYWAIYSLSDLSYYGHAKGVAALSVVTAVVVTASAIVTINLIQAVQHAEILQYSARKELVEAALKNPTILELERQTLIVEALSDNAWLAEKQYSITMWYGFDMPKELSKLKPISLSVEEIT